MWQAHFDFVKFYYGEATIDWVLKGIGSGALLVPAISGSFIAPETIETVVSTNNRLLMVFTSDDSIKSRGFRAHYEVYLLTNSCIFY